MNFWQNIIATSLISVLPLAHCLAADPTASAGQLTLSYSDGRPATHGVVQVNNVLKSVGVRVNTVAIPAQAKPVIEQAKTRALTQEENEKLISLFSLHRGDLLEQIELAGREPAAHRGGFLSTSEKGVAPYPKVYDMKAMTPDVMHYLQAKFGKLHVNSAENGIGIDEVMTIVSGGTWTWFFVLPDNLVAKLTLGYVPSDGEAWRISYPGLVPHGGFLDAPYGLVVAYAHGPEHFVMRYEEPSVQGSETLGTNPWIDFSKTVPTLLNTVKL
ncbi:hypothetical protein [Rheinheimera soli]|uniref:Uncharacterized protein n=1 Tax=Rheinheimera soli TaxID=443616 RepID=A0ABU1W205_9GAMM|nr:hypothetical protein [Rheinheimera soli]MDR7121999.1 hypothetical protein [Rheinheimera soli]